MTRRTRKPKPQTRTARVNPNANALFYRFPVQVLTRIFSSLKFQYENEFKGRKRSGWVVVTHVCQDWRRVALSCGTLWSSINTGNPSISDWLNRAAGTPLFVDLEIAVVADEATLTLVLQNIRQIQSLSIRIKPTIRPTLYKKIWNHVQMISSNPAPLLEFFELKDRKHGQPHSSLRLFDGSAPALRQFKACGWTPTLPAQILSNLTTISLCSPSPPLNKYAILAQLATMPSLEHVTLQDVIVPMELSMDAVPNIPVVRLPQLKQLIFTGAHFNTDLDFLSHLSFTAETAVTFSSLVKTPDLSALPRFFDTYLQTRETPASVRTLKLSWRNRMLYLVTRGLDTSMVDPTLVLTLVGPWEEDIFPILWGEELVRLPVNELEEFYVDCEIGDWGWTLLSRECDVLRYILVEQRATYEFVDYLIDDYQRNCPLNPAQDDNQEDFSNDKSVDNAAPFYAWPEPALYYLQTIEIVSMDFTGRERLVEDLAAALLARANLSEYPVEGIFMQDCEAGLNLGMFNTLSQAVALECICRTDLQVPYENTDIMLPVSMVLSSH